MAKLKSKEKRLNKLNNQLVQYKNNPKKKKNIEGRIQSLQNVKSW